VARVFTVRVAVSKFGLEPARAGRRPVAGVGHLRFSLDGGRYDEPLYAGANGRLALAEGVNGYFSPAYQPQITYRNIPAGSHKLTVQLVNRDDTPAGVAATVMFTVR
jgi:hypothetical protein